ncbi:MAG: tripartite tricarboxylate transporter substrate binding protein [Deltaproteobacteria bacterium]|nr:tripartite tricarboxylate transporter substrate binding protein [Deltaproteobacteria bacterium]
MLRLVTRALVAAALAAGPRAGTASPPAQCVAPARPGGGFELTCALLRAALVRAGVVPGLRTTYLPGGVGAVAFETFVTQRPAEADTLVAFSSGSLLNIAQGKFGKYGVDDVRWVAAVGVDYGAVTVGAASPHRSLASLMAALRADPQKVTFGIGGTVGGQDWMKAALLARAAGVEPRALRYVSFEGGGDAQVALQAGHVDVVPGDLAESERGARDGRVRILAVLADHRLGGRYAAVPTAAEQGYPVAWPTIRGVYLGRKVSDRDHARWVATFDRLLASEEFARLREEHGLLPFASTGAALESHVENTVRDHAALARSLGLPMR